MEEEWRPVVGYEGLYEVSSWGNVRSFPRVMTNSIGRVCRFRGRMLKLIKKKRTGYYQVSLCRDGEQKEVSVHRLVAEAFIGPQPDGMEILHGDADRTNNRVENLRWGTRRENQQEKVEHGNHPESRKKECPRGHPLELPNLTAHSVKVGNRSCLACNRAHARIRYRGWSNDVMQAVSDAFYEEIMEG